MGSGTAAGREIRVTAVKVAGEVARGQDLGVALARSGVGVSDGDIVVVSQKAVSKAEGRVVDLAGVRPSSLALGIASEYGKDARIVELVLSEARRIVRMGHGVMVTETRGGLVCANSGVDESNMPPGRAALLPEDADASARRVRSEISAACGADVGVIVSDTFGRPFRTGQVDCAIGAAGIEPSADHSGRPDAFGRILRVTDIAVADEIAGAAELAMEKASSCPMAVVSGTGLAVGSGAPATSLLRPAREDLFR
ncbi:MAG: coenzyme F420-0:L-glutamate ligase [Thaumarchaeota archaeon S15]|nr:MAG: coenzyme F420-0:L-glutamate ligase [Thaumarchaeota archaeon S15]